jgi:hypothetical protein
MDYSPSPQRNCWINIMYKRQQGHTNREVKTVRELKSIDSLLPTDVELVAIY